MCMSIIPTGVRSPVTVSSDSACNVLPSGHVDYDYHNVVPYNSYECSPDSRRGYGSCIIFRDGTIFGDYNYTSYGFAGYKLYLLRMRCMV